MMKSDRVVRELMQAAEKVSNMLSAKLGDNLVAVYVYGSVAREDCVGSSDVGLHIVLRDYSKAKDLPHTNWVDGVPVEAPPHQIYFYDKTPEWLLQNIDIAAKCEGLWEIDKIKVLYDPGNIVSSFRERIRPLLENKKLLKARANTSFKTAMAEMEEVKQNIDEGALDQALVHMYALGGGGDEYSGVAVQILKTVIKFSGLPLTTRRIWIRFTEACNKLDMPNLRKLLEDCYGMDRLDMKNLQEVFNEAFYLAKEVVAKSPVPDESINELERFKLTFREFMEGGEVGAAQVYLLGSFTRIYHWLDMGVEQKQIRMMLQEFLHKSSGLHTKRELEDRARIIQKAMNNIKSEWFTFSVRRK